ncbi:MAG: acetyl-CoA carboxylase biotin carboxyl carrier protein [Gammaproteobacteria bacterium]|nr:acetyl-CoA carboxylase biotin carboxyl carrier protein [Gammaproteobacteria bacterium]
MPNPGCWPGAISSPSISRAASPSCMAAAGPRPPGCSRRPSPHLPAAAPAPVSPNGQAAPPADDGLVAVESPMVGTFYTAANPDSEAFVNVGSQISDGSVVCIVEAMKVFNEIKAEVSGTIERICVKNGDAVEFGQPLFMVKPS